MSVATELADVRAIFVRDEEVAKQADGDAFRIESFRREGVAGVKGVRVPNERTVPLVSQESGVEERRLDVGERRLGVDVDVQEMKAIEVRHVGSAVERPAIRRGQEDVVEAGIGDGRPEASEGRLIDADVGIIKLADRLARQARQVERVARNETDADEGHAGLRRR